MLGQGRLWRVTAEFDLVDTGRRARLLRSLVVGANCALAVAIVIPLLLWVAQELPFAGMYWYWALTCLGAFALATSLYFVCEALGFRKINLIGWMRRRWFG